ncbi:MAG: tRNA-(ms[2]io[6]A)-hydroxylase [Myxococcaceae bacterium]
MSLTLRKPTPKAWLSHALANLDEVFIDHAHCEKKAAANALSLLQAYPDVPRLPSHMARLAREEAGHLARVLTLLEARGLSLGKDPGDPYVQALHQRIRSGHAERRLDRLLVAALVEARSHERLGLLATALPSVELRKLYAELARSEDGHQALFLRLAHAVAPKDVVAERLEAWLDLEQDAIDAVGLRAAIH